MMFASMMAMLVLAGQTVDPPASIKMGLWESTSVTVPMGATGAAAAKMKQQRERIGSPITTKWRLCHTAESWAGSINALNTQGESCKVRKREVTAHGVVVSATCTSGGGKLTFDYTAIYDSLEAMHSSTMSTIEFPAGGGSMVVNDTTKQRFVGPDCGSVQPGKKIEVP